MKTVGRYTRARRAHRLKSCQIASNYEPVDAYSRGKIFPVYTRLHPPAPDFSYVGKAPAEIFYSSYLSHHPVNHLVSYFCHSLTFSLDVFSAEMQIPGHWHRLLNHAIYRIDDAEEK